MKKLCQMSVRRSIAAIDSKESPVYLIYTKPKLPQASLKFDSGH